MCESTQRTKEMLVKKRKNLDCDHNLLYNEIRRISSFTDQSIFVKDICCLWTGYVSRRKKEPLFYFNQRKIPVKRLLYRNFVGTLGDDHYLRMSCKNKMCCSIGHMVKRTYQDYKWIPKTPRLSAQKVTKYTPIVNHRKTKTVEADMPASMYIDFEE